MIMNLTELQHARQELIIIERISEDFEQIWYNNEGARVDAVTKHLEILQQSIFDKVNQAEKQLLNKWF
ncbi:MAG: hypothetical protein DRQ98_14570 [Gammaproteobacteria bacterium]|nr:MAG: hypothetical protein DRQ98_14570 [Gammaproteobacteria bacterium]